MQIEKKEKVITSAEEEGGKGRFGRTTGFFQGKGKGGILLKE